MTVQFYAVGGTISDDCAKFVTVACNPVIGKTAVRSLGIHILIFIGLSDAKRLHGSVELPTQFQQMLTLAAPLADAQ